MYIRTINTCNIVCLGDMRVGRVAKARLDQYCDSPHYHIMLSITPIIYQHNCHRTPTYSVITVQLDSVSDSPLGYEAS